MKLLAVLLLLVLARAQTVPANAPDSSVPTPAVTQTSAAQNFPGQSQSPATQKPKRAQPQTALPDEGTVTGNRYTSEYFGFTYTFPEQFEVMEDLMQGEEDATKQAFVLLAVYSGAEEGKTRQGVVVMADRLQENSAGGNWAPKYFDTLAQPLQAHGAQRIGTVREYRFGEKKFYRGDFHRTGPDEGYQTILITLRQGYVLGFQFVAASEKEIDRLLTTLATLNFVSTNAKSGVVGPKQ